MKRAFIHTVLVAAVLIAAAAVRSAAQTVPTDERQALRARIEQRYDVVPLAGGIALTPKTPRGNVRLIEISDSIAINGVAVSGRELRERVGADADSILQLSYLGPGDVRRLFASGTPAEPPPAPEPPLERATPPEAATPSATPSASDREPPRRYRRSSGDRVRVFGDVVVNEGEEVSGQVVAVLGWSASTAKSAIRWSRSWGPWSSDRTPSCTATWSRWADGCGEPRARASAAA